MAGGIYWLLKFSGILLIFALGLFYSVHTAIVTFAAESGALGSNFAVSRSSPAYTTILSAGAGNNPGNAARVASYKVTFPSAEPCQLYARLRVGPYTFKDDSTFHAVRFGCKAMAEVIEL